jgi:hypothetical protein
MWYILTERKGIADFGGKGRDYLAGLNNTVNENATPGFDRNFPFFEFSEEEIQAYMNYPPLVVPFGEIKSNAGKNLFFQRVQHINTDNAMMSFYDKNSTKIAYLWGEGLWRWRLFSYRENGSHELFNTLIHKTLNYLIARRGNDRFVHDIKALYDETDQVLINVEFYNESYELVNVPDVQLQLKSEGKEFNYLLNRFGDKYRINLGNLTAGEYSYLLKTNFKGENFEKKGVFYVRSRNPELNDVVANKRLLQDIALHSGGSLTELKGLSALVDDIRDNTDLKIVERKEIRFVELGELAWLGIVLLVLLCVEWFLLKYFTE